MLKVYDNNDDEDNISGFKITLNALFHSFGKVSFLIESMWIVWQVKCKIVEKTNLKEFMKMFTI